MIEVEQPPTPPSCQSCPVSVCALNNCDERERDTVVSLRREFREVPRQASILRRYSGSTEYLTLQSGLAIRYGSMPDGGRAIYSFLLPGDPIYLPLLWGERPKGSVRALTDVSLCVFDKTEVAEAFRSQNSLFENLGRYITRQVAACDARNAGFGRLSAKARIVRLLLELFERLSPHGAVQNEAIDFPLKQRHIADALGITSVHVSRIMSELRRDNIIRFDAQRLTIVDLPLMVELSDLQSGTA